MLTLSLLLAAHAAPPEASSTPPASEVSAPEGEPATPRWPGELELDLSTSTAIDDAGHCFPGASETDQKLYVWIPTADAADLGLLSAQACGEGGLGYACGPGVDAQGEVEALPEDELRLQRGANWAGHMAMPVGWRHTEVRLRRSPRGVALTFTVLGQGSPLGEDGLGFLCDEAQQLVAGAAAR